LLSRAVEVALSFAKNSPIAVQSIVRTLRHQKVLSQVSIVDHLPQRNLFRYLVDVCCCFSLMDWIKLSREKPTVRLFATHPVIIFEVLMESSRRLLPNSKDGKVKS
jgi:hypothetical protein